MKRLLSAAVALVLAVSLAGCSKAPARKPGASSAAPEPTPSPTPVVVEATPTPAPTPNPALGFIDTSLYESVILPETPAADDAYIANTLFVGDSNTVRYELLGGTDIDNNIGCAGMGFGSITSFPCVDFNGYNSLTTIPQAIKLMQPQRVVFGFGSNNLQGDAATVVEDYRRALKKCIEVYPYYTVIISAVPPLDENRTDTSLKQEKVDALNKEIVRMCSEEGWYFLNSAEAMKDWQTGWSKKGLTTNDGLHLSQEGVDAYMEYVRTHAIEEKDTRPAVTAYPRHNRPSVDLLFHPTPTPAPQATGVTIEYRLEGQGRLEGNLKQTVKPGDAAEGVWVYPADGWQFTHWEISLAGQSYSEQECLRLSIPEDYTVNKVIATAFTVYVDTPAPAEEGGEG